MNKIVDAIIAAVIAVVIIGSVLMVAIDDNVILRKNNDYGSMAEYSNTDWSATFSTDGTTATWSVDGVEQTSFRMSNAGRVFLVMSDEFTLFFDQNTSGGVPIGGIAYNKNNVSIGINDVSSCNVSMTDGVITCTVGEGTNDPIVSNSKWVFVAKDLGDYRTFNLSNYTSADIYFTSIDQIYGVNYVGTTGNVWFSFHGDNVEYGDTALKMNITSKKVGENVYSSTVNTTSSDWQFTVDNDGSDYTVNPYVWIVPYEVSGTAFGISSSVENIIGAIPVIVIVAVLLAIIAAFFRTRY